MKNIFRLLPIFIIFCGTSISFADSSVNNTENIGKYSLYQSSSQAHSSNPVVNREKQENKIPPNFFSITLYKPTYLLPYYYTASPDNAVYQNNTPNNEQLKSAEVKYQFSFKVPVWKNILNHRSSLYLAYTQLSYWQVYNHNAFFRESDYEPELFLTNEVNFHLVKNWRINLFNIGASHQSNGYGNALERSWNRLYIDVTASSDNWMVSIKPWYIISTNNNNNNIAQFLGYGRILLAYKHQKQVFALSAHNILESGGKRATAELTWSFPLTPYIKGYIQLFSGYGQSLIEYNHRTNSAGIGIALSDWI